MLVSETVAGFAASIQLAAVSSSDQINVPQHQLVGLFAHACACAGYYPSAAAEQRQAGGGKKSRRGSTKSRGDKGFIEGWYVRSIPLPPPL
uniref:Predicted protein n=1 Tax=Hordeum vulgare subsp. vulgare TaxID=112509 RepID=F2EFM5_HORVV|nr:predicted protein [Hordeum vulgare subsp. vulgare]